VVLPLTRSRWNSPELEPEPLHRRTLAGTLALVKHLPFLLFWAVRFGSER
jgi:hypothetical protein